MPDNAKKVTGFGNKVSRNLYFVYNLAINALRNVFQNVLFTNDERATSRRFVKMS